MKVCLEHLPAAALGIDSCTGGKTSAGFSAVNLISLGLFWAQGCCFNFPSNEAFGSPSAGFLYLVCFLESPGNLVTHTYAPEIQLVGRGPGH